MALGPVFHKTGLEGDIGVSWDPFSKEVRMSVARVTKITASSRRVSTMPPSRAGPGRKTVRGITGLEIVSQKAKVDNGKIAEYRVTMEVTFILE
jgi:flavin-binding protein dodecin